MSYTDKCDVFALISEGAINTAIDEIQLQRPSLFNYGTRHYLQKPHRMCREIKSAPRLPPDQPLITRQPYFSIPGTDLGIEYCAQLAELKIDIYPESVFSTPPDLDSLASQDVGLKAEFCVGISPSDPFWIEKIADNISSTVTPVYRPTPLNNIRERGITESGDEEEPIIVRPIPPGDLHLCYCVEVFVICSVETIADAFGHRIALRLKDIELVDVFPQGLEDILEGIIRCVLSLGVLPRLRFSLDRLQLSIGEFGKLTISPTPVSPPLPNNPALDNDSISIFVNANL